MDLKDFLVDNLPHSTIFNIGKIVHIRDSYLNIEFMEYWNIIFEMESVMNM
jgi:hypothetical protein